MPLTRLALRLLPVAALALATEARADDRTEKAACVAAADEGQVLRDAHRLREARDRFVACARDACPGPVRKQCGEWLGEVEAGLPSVVLVATLAGQPLADVRVTMDGAPLAERLGTEAVPVDPGVHTFRFERAGSPPVEVQATVREGDKYLRVVAALAPAAPTPALAPAPTPPPAPAPAPDGGPVDRLDDRMTPAIDLSLSVGGRAASAFADAGTVGPTLMGAFEVAWRPVHRFDFALFGDLAGGPVKLDPGAASAASVKQQDFYGNGTIGLRARWYAISLGVDTIWFAADFAGLGESWQFSGTSTSTSTSTPGNGNFNYTTSMLGGGLLAGIDFPVQSPWVIGVVARGSAFFGPHGSRVSCGTSADCTGEVPGGSIDQHAFFDLALRLRWSLSTR